MLFFKLLLASLLGYGCILDSQCRVKVKNSRCIDGLCGCEANHIPLRKDKCLPRKYIFICITKCKYREKSLKSLMQNSLYPSLYHTLQQQECFLKKNSAKEKNAFKKKLKYEKEMN